MHSFNYLYYLMYMHVPRIFTASVYGVSFQFLIARHQAWFILSIWGAEDAPMSHHGGAHSFDITGAHHAHLISMKGHEAQSLLIEEANCLHSTAWRLHPQLLSMVDMEMLPLVAMDLGWKIMKNPGGHWLRVQPQVFSCRPEGDDA